MRVQYMAKKLQFTEIAELSSQTQLLTVDLEIKILTNNQTKRTICRFICI
jgi:hypothetical protein